MKFGHYTPDELGIRRGITCAMFTSSGAEVECANYSEQQLAKAKQQYAGLLKETVAAKEQARKLEKKLASAPDEQVAAIKSEILRFRQDVVDKIAEKLNTAIKSQTNLSECKASREVYQEYSQTSDILSSLTSEILKRETKIKKKQRQANRKMSNPDEEAADVQCENNSDGLNVQCFTVQELAREKDKESAVYHVLDAFKHDDPGEYLDDIKTEKALAKAQREYERDIKRIYEIANRNLQALQKEAEAKGATDSKRHYVWLAGELKKEYEEFQRFTQRAYKERLAELKSAQSKSMSNDFDVQCSVGRWDSREAAEHGLSVLSGYIENQIRKGANIQQLTQNVRARISEGLNEMAKAGCSDRDRKAAAKACDRILETLRARGAKCAMRSLDDVFNESDKVCEDHIRAILQDVKEARRTVKGWAGTSDGAKVNYKLQAKYREGAKDLLSRIKKRGKVSAAKLSELEMMIQQICGITAHTEWEFQRIVKEQQK